MPRLFFALLPQAGDRVRLHALAIAAAARGARPLPAPDLHLTLCFLGEAPAAPALALLQAMTLPPPPSLRFDSLDYWARSGVLCAIPHSADTQGIHALASDIRTGLEAAGCTFDDKPFRAHVTLARQRAPSIAQQRWPQALAHPMTVSFDSLALLESRPGAAAGEPRYAPLGARLLAPQPP